MGIGIFIGIGSTLLVIGALLIFGATRDPLLMFFTWIKDLFFGFMDVTPNWFKPIFFLFLLVFVIGAVITGFLSFLFFCDGSTVYQPTTFFNGVGLALGSVFQNQTEYGNLTSSQYESLLTNNTVLYSAPGTNTPEGLFIIKCVYQEPVLTVFGIEIFSYRTWIFILLLAFFVWLMFKMKMG